jgi:membrane-associated phospholipid phosphatase
VQENPEQKSRNNHPGWFSRVQNFIAPEWARRHRARLFQAYLLIAVVGFAILALLADMTEYLPFELTLTRALQSQTPGWLGFILRWVNWPGFAPQNFILVGVAMVVLSMLGLRWEGMAAVIAALSTGTLNYLIKISIRRPRPGADLVEVLHILDSYSFPSGHVMFYTTFFGFLVFLAFTLLTRSLRRTMIMLLPGTLILLVGVARMYVGEHWITDVVAGYLLGSLVLVLAVMIYRWGKPRFFVDQPVAPSLEPEDDTL